MAKDTIAAVGTPPGEGGIGIVRLSGPAAFEIARNVFLGPEPASHRMLHGKVVDGEEVLDDVVLLPYRAPHSYTGEDVIEICCHGGGAVTSALLALCLRNGARSAEPGEFTKLAFLNGKMDLAQAEGVCDLIRAATESQRRLAIRQVTGELSRTVAEIRNRLLSLLAEAEAAVDFAEEVGELDVDRARASLEAAASSISRLRDSFRTGRLLREGATVAIAGLPNVGKSSLLNALLGVDRAIVTEIPGTTRDTIADRLHLDGLLVSLVDTAGLRDATDTIEKLGVLRTRDAIEGADLVLLVLSPDNWRDPANAELAEQTAGRCMVALNKADLAVPDVGSGFAEVIPVSAKTGEGLASLRAALRKRLAGEATESALVSRERHHAALLEAESAVRRGFETLDNDVPTDFLCIDLRAALDSLGLITGETVTADVVERIFSDFCVGK